MGLSLKLSAARAAPPPVTNSFELQRVLALPRRVLDLETVQDLTPVFRKSGGTMKMFPVQSAALLEAHLHNGLVCEMGVGSGKTLVTLLAPEAMDSQNALLIVPTGLKRKTEREIDTVYGKHFNLPLDRLTIITYEQLSSQADFDILEEIYAKRPFDLVVIDEGHWLKNKRNARGRRFNPFMESRPQIRLVVLSGTLTSRLPSEAGHLAEYALHARSPWPRGYRELKDWDGALGVKPEYEMSPGALRQFCEENETARDGFRRRINDTPGVIVYADTECSSSINVEKLKPAIPSKLDQLMKQVDKAWSIDGYEFDSAATKAMVLRQMSCGFYYRWAWPNGEPDYEWLEARCAWNRATREKLAHSKKKGMDSPGMLFNAARRWDKGKREGLVWFAPEYEAWAAIKSRYRPEPPKETIWLDDFLVNDAIKRAEKLVKEKGPTIIWYTHRAVGKRLGELTGLPVYGGGTDASETTDDILIASVRVQSEGKNLQHYRNNVMTSLPSKGDILEQTMGRTHRPGQLADEVWFYFYQHTWACQAALMSCIEDAKYKLEARGLKQKILIATVV